MNIFIRDFVISSLFYLSIFLGYKSCHKNDIVPLPKPTNNDSLLIVKLENLRIRGEINVLNGTLIEKEKDIKLLSDNTRKIKGELILLSNFILKYKIDSNKIKRDTDYVYLNYPVYFKDSTVKSFSQPYNLRYSDSGLDLRIKGKVLVDTNRILVLSDSVNLSIYGILGITKYSPTELRAYFVSSSPLLTDLNFSNRSYFLEPTLIKNRKFSLGFQLGAGVNSNFKIIPYVGVGLSYNLINF